MERITLSAAPCEGEEQRERHQKGGERRLVNVFERGRGE